MHFSRAMLGPEISPIELGLDDKALQGQAWMIIPARLGPEG